MAITVTTDMKYTRPGEGTPSNVLSAHNALIWLFQDGAIAANPTAKVQIDVLNTAGGVIFASDPFDAYLLDYSSPVAKFRFDATQIIKHIITNYFYKEMSNDVISPQDYGNEIQVNIVTFDNAVQEDAETIEYFGSHAVNQIGDEYGANIPRIFYNDTEEIAHFLGFPNHVFFYAPTTLVVETPAIQIINSLVNLITAWVNTSYDTFTTSGSEIISAIASTGSEAKSNAFSIITGQTVILVFDLTLNSGQLPIMVLWDDLQGLGDEPVSNQEQAAAGDNIIILNAFQTTDNCKLRWINTGASNHSTDVSATLLESYLAEGTLGLYVHDINIGLFHLSASSKQIKISYDPSAPVLVKTFNLTVFEPCENAVYVRWLTRDGYYMYWAFTPFKVSSVEAQKIGNVINSFDEQALANSRNFLIGYKNSFDKIAVSAATVPIVFLRKLMELFISPAVYLWQGKETPDENLISSLSNFGYEIFTSSGTVVISAIETGSSGSLLSNAVQFTKGQTVIVIFDLTLNSGQAPNVRIVNGDINSISNIVNSANGFNAIELTLTETTLGLLRFLNSAAANYSTDKILVKNPEVETDWILLEAVEGSHNLREKKQHDNFNATLVLPENFTQTLGGSDL